MLTLHVEAVSYQDLVRKVSAMLLDELRPLTARPSAIAEPVTAVGTSTEVRRGRPRGSKKNSETTQPAVVENTGSAPADTSPAAEDADAAATEQPGGETPAPVAAITFEEFRAKVQKAAEAKDGIKKVGDVLAKFGAKKVRDPKPEQYPEIIVELDKLIGESA